MIPIAHRNKVLRRRNEQLIRQLVGDEAAAKAVSQWTSTSRPDFLFRHGLGDCFNAATLFHAVAKVTGQHTCVECPPAFKPVFHAAGVVVASGATRAHPWDHPAYSGPLLPIWVDNKTAHNSPVPMTEEIWNTMVTSELRLRFPQDELSVKTWFDTLPRPIVLLHTRGATSGHYKDFPCSLEESICREFNLGTLIWLSGRHPRVLCHHPASVGRLYSMIAQADLVIGIDSGPLHVARWTDTPALGCWFALHPTAFAIPSPRIRHLVSTGPQVPTQYGAHDRYLAALPSRMAPFNLLAVTKLTAETILYEANRLLH